MLVQLRRPACRHSTPLTWQTLLPLAVILADAAEVAQPYLVYFSVPRKSAGQQVVRKYEAYALEAWNSPPLVEIGTQLKGAPPPAGLVAIITMYILKPSCWSSLP